MAKTYKQLRRETEKVFEKLGKKESQKYYDRVYELVAQIKNFTFEKIIMGNGSWIFEGKDFKIVWNDCDDEDITELSELDVWILCKNNLSWQPKNITKKEIKIIEEIMEILNDLTDIRETCWLNPIDFIFSPE